MYHNNTDGIADPSTQTRYRPVLFCPLASDFTDYSHDPIVPWILIAIASIASAITMPLNTLVIIAVSQRKELQKNSNILLSSLAVADLLRGVLSIPVLSVTAIFLLDSQVSLDHFCTLHTINVNLMACLVFSSLYHLTAVAWERYIATRKWMKYKVTVTRKYLKNLAIFAWLSAIVTTIPLLTMELAGLDTKVLKAWILVANVCGAVTFIAIAYFYITVYLGVRKRKTSEVRLVTSLRQAKLQSKVAMTTGLMRVLFPTLRTTLFIHIFGTLFHLNALINPLLYCYRDRHFRNALLQLLKITKPQAIIPRIGDEGVPRRQHRCHFASQANVQQELKTEEKRSRLTRSASWDLSVVFTDDVMLKRTMSALSVVKFSSVFDELQLQKPSSVLLTTDNIYAKNNVRYQTRKNKPGLNREDVDMQA